MPVDISLSIVSLLNRVATENSYQNSLTFPWLFRDFAKNFPSPLLIAKNHRLNFSRQEHSALA